MQGLAIPLEPTRFNPSNSELNNYPFQIFFQFFYLILLNMVPNSVGSAHRVQEQTKYFVSAEKLNKIQLDFCLQLQLYKWTIPLTLLVITISDCHCLLDQNYVNSSKFILQDCSFPIQTLRVKCLERVNGLCVHYPFPLRTHHVFILLTDYLDGVVCWQFPTLDHCS